MEFDRFSQQLNLDNSLYKTKIKEVFSYEAF